MNLANAEQYANRMREKLEPFCDRIEIVGSVRRQRLDGIKDVELLIIPTESHEAKPGEMFPTGPWFPLLRFLDHMTSEGDSKFSRGAWGDRYRKLILDANNFPFDLFIIDPIQWGVAAALRTGPATFSKLLVTNRMFGGALPDGWKVCNGKVFDRNGIHAKKTFEKEAEFFDFLELPHWEPKYRTEYRLKRYLESQVKV